MLSCRSNKKMLNLLRTQTVGNAGTPPHEYMHIAQVVSRLHVCVNFMPTAICVCMCIITHSSAVVVLIHSLIYATIYRADWGMTGKECSHCKLFTQLDKYTNQVRHWELYGQIFDSKISCDFTKQMRH